MMADALSPAPKTPWFAFWRSHPVALAFSTVGLLAVIVAGTTILKTVGLIRSDILDFFIDSDEAPIRVRNGSLDLYLLTTSQKWQPVGGSDNWRIGHSSRFKDEFEITVAVKAGATCGGSLTATGSDVIFTFAGKTLRLQSQGKHTLVKPGNGITMTWDKATPQKLSYAVNGGYLESIAVGNGANPATLCTFSDPKQLDHIIVLNVP